MTPQQIRQQYRQRRHKLSAVEQQQSAYQLSLNLNQFLRYSNGLKLGSYLATQSEISMNPWIANTDRHRIYLPVLYEVIQPKLRFAELTDLTQWKANKYNILEPECHWGETLHPRQLDIIFLPLVAFDREGYRLGMGGGFYDRSTAFRQSRKHWQKPRLIGIAHSCQEHTGLPRQPWDVPLDGLITDQEIIDFGPR